MINFASPADDCNAGGLTLWTTTYLLAATLPCLIEPYHWLFLRQTPLFAKTGPLCAMLIELFQNKPGEEWCRPVKAETLLRTSWQLLPFKAPESRVCLHLGHSVDHANVEPGGQIIHNTFSHEDFSRCANTIIYIYIYKTYLSNIKSSRHFHYYDYVTSVLGIQTQHLEVEEALSQPRVEAMTCSLNTFDQYPSKLHFSRKHLSNQKCISKNFVSIVKVHFSKRSRPIKRNQASVWICLQKIEQPNSHPWAQRTAWSPHQPAKTTGDLQDP